MKPDIKAKVDEFFHAYRQRIYRQGEILVRADEQPPGIFYLVRGRVRQYDVTGQGNVVIANIFMPPAFFPMSWGFNQTDNHYFFEAMDEVELWMAPREDTVEFLRTSPAVLIDLVSRLYRGVDGMQERMVHLMAASAYNRVILELLIAAKRLHRPDKPGEIQLEMTDNELAGRTGLTRETVSRELQKLKAENIVSLKQGSVTIIDLHRLEAAHGSGI